MSMHMGHEWFKSAVTNFIHYHNIEQLLRQRQRPAAEYTPVLE